MLLVHNAKLVPSWDHVMECEPKGCLPFLCLDTEYWVFNPLCSHLQLHSQLKAKDPAGDTKGTLRDGERYIVTGDTQI